MSEDAELLVYAQKQLLDMPDEVLDILADDPEDLPDDGGILFDALGSV